MSVSRYYVHVQLDDKYGSPMLEDIETFARALYREMESMMGEEEAGEITVEASSPVRLFLQAETATNCRCFWKETASNKYDS